MILRFDSLQGMPGLHHAVTTREGGVSLGPYASLNLGLHVGDEADAVHQNRRRLAEYLGYDPTHLVCAQQVHGVSAHCVAISESGRGAWHWDDALPASDALIVAAPGIPAMILVADCAPILAVDPIHRVFALIHAGWRGAVGGIVGATLSRMSEEYGTQPHDVFLGIGPCLCVHCLEVGDEVASQVPPAFTAFIRRGLGPKPHLDLRAIISADAQRAGVIAAHIETMPACPRCQTERFFSHRGQGGVAGRFALVAWWE